MVPFGRGPIDNMMEVLSPAEGPDKNPHLGFTPVFAVPGAVGLFQLWVFFPPFVLLPSEGYVPRESFRHGSRPSPSPFAFCFLL